MQNKDQAKLSFVMTGRKQYNLRSDIFSSTDITRSIIEDPEYNFAFLTRALTAVDGDLGDHASPVQSKSPRRDFLVGIRYIPRV